MQPTLTQQTTAPKVGLLINSIDVFNPQAKDQSEGRIRDYFDSLRTAGIIHPDSLVRGRIFGPHEVLKVADEFASQLVDLIVISNVAFPNGQVFLTLATHPHLAKVPVAVVADPEPGMKEWATNAWCGVIMNNHVAKQIGRPIEAIPGPVSGDEFRARFETLLRVAGTIKALKRDFLGRFGDAPGGFHSATGDQLSFAAVFGTRVDTVDLTAVTNVYQTGKASGYLGESTFTDDDVKNSVAAVSRDRKVSVEPDVLERGVRIYHAFKAIIEANGYTSASFRCWPEMNEPYIGVSACMAVGLLLANGDITGAACEGDWPTAVAQTMGTLLSGRPSPCLDWVNYTGGSDIIQLGHCGMGVCGSMCAECDEIGLHPVIRQGGGTMGPVHLGQFEYGPKTGICLMQGPDSRFKLLAFAGESSPETAKSMIYSASDIRVANHARLNELILEHGFPHHLAMAFGDVTEELRMLCGYLGVEFVSPNVGSPQ